MADNKFIKMLKENWIGGVIGVFISLISSPIILGRQTMGPMLSTFGNMGTSGTIIFIVLGYIVGAFIQSKCKK